MKPKLLKAASAHYKEKEVRDVWNWVWSLLCPLPLSVHAQPYNTPSFFFFFFLHFTILCGHACTLTTSDIGVTKICGNILTLGWVWGMYCDSADLLACPHGTLHRGTLVKTFPCYQTNWNLLRWSIPCIAMNLSLSRRSLIVLKHWQNQRDRFSASPGLRR